MMLFVSLCALLFFASSFAYAQVDAGVDAGVVANAVAPLGDVFTDIGAALAPLVAAVAGKQWMVFAALLLILCVSILRKYLAPHIAWFKTDVGAVALTGITSLGGALGTAMMSGRPIDVALLVDMLKITFGAMGGYSMLKKFLGPLLSTVIAGVTKRPDASASELAASAKGAQAVAEKPAGGAEEVVGEATEVK